MFRKVIVLITIVASSTWSKQILENRHHCSASEFTCEDGSCVPLNRYCDGINDCNDSSDEATCLIGESPEQLVLQRTKKQVPLVLCGDEEWNCKDGTCISHNEKCNGVIDCPDGSDESALICETNSCTESQFRCSYGACVANDAPCNDVFDCADNSDELLAYCFNQNDTQRYELEIPPQRLKRQAKCGKAQWQCRDGTCISIYGKCDGMKDCPDGSDETFALCRNTPCQSNWFRCTYGACVDGTAPCNNVQECADNSDELLPRCRNQSEEVRGTFKCDDGKEIPASAHCDGAKDCTDGSDETVKACAGKTCASYLFQCAYGACVDQGSDCDNKQDCADGSDESDELCNRTSTVTPPVVPLSGGSCRLPPYPANGHYVVSNVRGAVPGQSFYSVGLNVTCNPGYALTASSARLCIDGMWQPRPVSDDDCVRFCRLNKDPSVHYRCLYLGNSDGSRECQEYEPSGTIVRPDCNRPNYYYPGILPYMRCIDGNWDYVARCNPGLAKNGTNITILIKDKVEVHISGFQYIVNKTADGDNVTANTGGGSTTSNNMEYDYSIDEEDWRMGPPTKRTRYPTNTRFTQSFVINSSPKPTTSKPFNEKFSVTNNSKEAGNVLNFNIRNSTVTINAGDKIYFREDEP